MHKVTKLKSHSSRNKLQRREKVPHTSPLPKDCWVVESKVLERMKWMLSLIADALVHLICRGADLRTDVLPRF